MRTAPRRIRRCQPRTARPKTRACTRAAAWSGVTPSAAVRVTALRKPRPCTGGVFRESDFAERVPWNNRHAIVPDETVILLHPPLPLVGFSIGTERGCQRTLPARAGELVERDGRVHAGVRARPAVLCAHKTEQAVSEPADAAVSTADSISTAVRPGISKKSATRRQRPELRVCGAEAAEFRDLETGSSATHAMV